MTFSANLGLVPGALAETNSALVSPAGIPLRSGAEFYSTNPNQKVLVPVNIWGEVKEPGVHYVPVGASLMQVISLAGGPTGAASLPKVQLFHSDGKQEMVNIYSEGLKKPLAAGDTVNIDIESWKVNLPLIFGGVSTLVGVATLLVVLFNKGN